MPNGPPVMGSRFSATELHDDRHAESGDGEIVGAQADGHRADQQRDEAGGERAAKPAQSDRQAETAEAVRIVGRGQQRRDVGADGDETGDADVEQAGLPPLHVEAEADDGVGQRHGQEERAVAHEVEAHAGPPEHALRAEKQHQRRG